MPSRNKNVQFKGFDEMGKFLKQFPEEIRTKDFHFANKKAADIVRDKIKKLVPIDEGELEDDIRTFKTTKKQYALDSQYTVGIKKRKRSSDNQVPPEVYATFVEHGTAHQKANPFFRPGVDSSKLSSLKELRTRMSKRIALRLKQQENKSKKYK